MTSEQQTALMVAGSAVAGVGLGYALAYLVARSRGNPGAVSLTHPSYAFFDPRGDGSCTLPVLYAGAPPANYKPQNAIAATEPAG